MVHVHGRRLKPQRYSMHECIIDHYSDTNNGVVLRCHNDVIIYIDGGVLGVNSTNKLETVKARAHPIFEQMIKMHNEAFVEGLIRGEEVTKASIRKALGL